MLSVVAICKNEKSNVNGFLASWSEVADEIVILDTGSSDGTWEELMVCEAQKNGKLRAHRTHWNRDFSEARNMATKLACGTWILWADMDDRVDTNSISEIKKLAKDNDNKVYRFQVASDLGDGNWHRFMQTRMFPNLPSMKFRGQVHENLEQSVLECESKVCEAPEIIVAHLGYASESIRKQKAIRNLEILLENQNFEDGAQMAQIGDSLFCLGKYFVGIGYYERACKLAGESAKRDLAEKMCMGYLQISALRKAKETLESMADNSVRKYFWEGEIALAYGDKEKALRFFSIVKHGERGLNGRECNADSLISRAAFRIKQFEGTCVLV